LRGLPENGELLFFIKEKRGFFPFQVSITPLFLLKLIIKNYDYEKDDLPIGLPYFDNHDFM